MGPRRHVLAFALFPALLLGGSTSCRSGGDALDASEVAPGHAICPVCRAMGDLACQDVTIRPETPHSSHAGVAYYFCSAQCQKDFEKKPEAYLPH